MKSVQIQSFFWSVFSRIRTEYGDLPVNLRIQSVCGKIWIRKNSVFGHFSRSVTLITLMLLLPFSLKIFQHFLVAGSKWELINLLKHTARKHYVKSVTLFRHIKCTENGLKVTSAKFFLQNTSWRLLLFYSFIDLFAISRKVFKGKLLFIDSCFLNC